VIAVVLSVVVGAAVARFEAPTSKELDHLIASVHGQPVAFRVQSLSARFLGMRYVDDPLGEGQGRDPDPLVRYDAADCQTFVETVLALASSRNADEAARVLQEIRYSGSVQRYEDRNHFTESQWIPNALRRGFLRDVTREVGGDDVVDAGKEITAEAWTKRTQSRNIDLPLEKAPIGSAHFSIIPIDRILSHAASMPSGTLMLVVRKDLPGYMTRISHMGFVIHKDSATILRHAGSVAGHVVDEDIRAFLARHRKFTKWPVEGVWLFAPADRASAGPVSPAR
jgi:hypothetical protein